MADDAARFLPLSSAVLHILVALAGRELHGYGIMRDVLEQSDGRYRLGPGTLYANLQKLSEQGLVLELGRRAGESDSRRLYYRLTGLGRRVLSAEIERLESLVREARLRIPTAKPRRV